ncbi:site-specific integrase [Streptomyces sp. NPDC006923]|uniref:tyrosine-type recombinase/integrase n=1 Tax=Streptomyces sp. NPDC006923 TaxID=3155355 RepID=UPI0033F9AE9D
MTQIEWVRYPHLATQDHARRWLQFTANLGRAPSTIDAYGRSVEDHLHYCVKQGEDPLTLKADVVAGWIGDLRTRPNPRSVKVIHFDSGAGLANATIQLRVVAARSFYAFLVEDGLRELNPVRRGQSGRGGRHPRRGLVRRVEKAPWIPTEVGWSRILTAVRTQPLRNRLMTALAYDGALRREELTQLDVEDIDPAYSLIHLRAETTKSQRAREVAYGAATGQLLMAYLNQRRARFGRIGGAVFRSESRRNFGEPLSEWTWSKVAEDIARRSKTPNLSTHTFRHLRLTDLARADWTLDQIAQYAGHRDLDTTMKYIHLSGRELAERFQRANNAVTEAREQLLAFLVEA